ncbi:4Fe-4S binding protein [Halosquirtibacter laminarini]|uniref:4Fe-4S binding protein n=2 Tax=Halosquirtibacter laminarini TaxID=3374600 RepID=A0AC61NJM3_9BACT|nr:4Fe-4S binding protein [Prolixibacteraceae bacterium]
MREIIKIDEDLCNGCGLCIPNCHEGALRIIDNKARLISDLMCDGLGACIGHCPKGAIQIEKREAAPYDEILVIKDMVKKGLNTVVAHLCHLKDYNEMEFVRQGVSWMSQNQDAFEFDLQEVKKVVHNHKGGTKQAEKPEEKKINMKSSLLMDNASSGGCGSGCPGSQNIAFDAPAEMNTPQMSTATPSALRQWPVQMHLLNPNAPFLRNADLLVAADCVAFTLGNFHSEYLQGKALAIACPKLDSQQQAYVDKLIMMINEARINTITVMLMEVPCCGGLLRLVQEACLEASRKVPVKTITVSVQGEILDESWV